MELYDLSTFFNSFVSLNIGNLFFYEPLLLQDLLLEPSWRNLMTVEDLRALTPLIYRHVNPYGLFPLDMTTRLPLTAC